MQRRTLCRADRCQAGTEIRLVLAVGRRDAVFTVPERSIFTKRPRAS